MFLSVLLSTTWVLLNHPTADLIVWGQLFQEMDLATASIARDLGGAAARVCQCHRPTRDETAGALFGVPAGQ